METPKLKNSVIYDMAQNGLANITDHSVDPKHAYKVYTFRHEGLKAAKEIDTKRAELVKEAGIDDGAKFYARRLELTQKPERTEEEQKELDALNEKAARFGELLALLLAEETELKVKTIPYEEYHKLSGENAHTPVVRPLPDGTTATGEIDFFMAFREDLRGVLWAPPVDNE